MWSSGTYKGISLFIKVIIALASLVFIYVKITDPGKTETFNWVLNERDSSSTIYFLIVFALMLLNWGLETAKWKFLITPLEKISWNTSLKSILSGITVGIYTPNRVGEIGGKIFFLQKANRVQATFISLLGSVSQLVVTVLAGAISIIFYFSEFTFIAQEYHLLYYTLVILLTLLVLLLLICYFNPFLLPSIMQRVKLFSWLTKYTDVLLYYDVSSLFKILFYSTLRYLTFTIQFYLLLIAFGVDIPLPEAFVMIGLVFLTVTLVPIPSIAITEIGVRGSAALIFLGNSSDNDAGILAASFILWTINIAIPAIIGIPLIFKWKLFNTESL